MRIFKLTCEIEVDDGIFVLNLRIGASEVVTISAIDEVDLTTAPTNYPILPTDEILREN